MDKTEWGLVVIIVIPDYVYVYYVHDFKYWTT